MLNSRLDAALKQALEKLINITSPTAHVSFACPLHPPQFNDWRLFKGDAYAVPPMSEGLQSIVREIVALLDTRADMSLVRDPKTDEIIRDTLNEMLNKAPLTATSSSSSAASASYDPSTVGALPLSSSANLTNMSDPYAHNSSTPLSAGGGVSYGMSSGASHAGPAALETNTGGNGGGGGGGDTISSFSDSAVVVNPVEASIHLCDAIYDIQYSDAATRHTRLCRHLILIITLSPHEQHIRFAACVYRKILKSVAMAQKASQLKRRAHVGQGRLAQMNEASQQFLNNIKDPQHTAATGMELAKLNIINVWEDLARDLKDLCENTLRQHSGGRAQPHQSTGYLSSRHHQHHAHSSSGRGGHQPLDGQQQSGTNSNAITTLNMNSTVASMHQRSSTQALGLLMIIQATFPFLPTNCSIFHAHHSFRATLLAVVAVLSGSTEGYVRIAAADCLGIILTRHVKPSEVQTETNQLFETLLRNLRQGNCPENVAVGVCVTMKALLSIRGPTLTTTAAATAGRGLALSVGADTVLSPNVSIAASAATTPQGTSLQQLPDGRGGRDKGALTSPLSPTVPTAGGVTVAGGSTAANSAGASKATFDHNLVIGFCATAVELHRNTRQPSVRSALASLFPFLARVDPHFESRRAAYADAIIEPLKNIRDMDRKAQELYNFFAFLQSMGEYDALKNSTRVSFEAVLLRLLTSSVSPGQTGDTLSDTFASAQQLMLPTACWYVIGAIFKNKTTTNLHALVQRDCLVLLQHTVLTPGMLEAIKLICEGTAPFIAAFDDAIHARARHVLLHTAELINSLNDPNNTTTPNNGSISTSIRSDPNTQGPTSTSPPATHTGPSSVSSPIRRSPTTRGGSSIFNWFGGGNSNSNAGQNVSSQPQSTAPTDGQQGSTVSSRTTSGLGGGGRETSSTNNALPPAACIFGKRQPPQLYALHRPPHIDEVMAAMDIFSKQQHFVSFYARNGGAGDPPEVVAYNYWREMSTLMLPLLAHPVALVRAQCGRLLGHLYRMTIVRAYPSFSPQHQNNTNSNTSIGQSAASLSARALSTTGTKGSLNTSPHVTPYNPMVIGTPPQQHQGVVNKILFNGNPITLYARAGMVPFLTAFARRIVFEVDTRVKVALLHSLSGGTSGMLIPGQGQFPTIHSELVPQDVIECFASLINHVRRVREASLEVILGVGGTTGVPSDRAHRSLRKLVSMHIKAVGHLQDPHQIASSCSTLTLLFEHRPSLLTVDILSTLMHASCEKLRQLYGNRLLTQYNNIDGGDGGNGLSSGSGGSGLQGLGVYDSQAKHRAMLAVQEGEEGVGAKLQTAHDGVGYSTGGLSGSVSGSFSGGVTLSTTPRHYSDHSGSQNKSSAAGKTGEGAALYPHPTYGTLHAVAVESAQTIVLLELINQLLIAGKMIQRQRLAASAAVAKPAGLTESPTTRGGGKGFPTVNTATGSTVGVQNAMPPSPATVAAAQLAASASVPSPVSALTESSETRSILETLWSCLLHSSRTINIVTSATSAASVSPTASGAAGIGSTSTGGFSHHRRTLSNSNAPLALATIGPASSVALPAGASGAGGSPVVSGSYSSPPAAEWTGLTMDAQLVQIANAVTIQHQALYALTDLLTLAPQNIIDFAYKTALIEYLRSEYLRCCGPQGQASSFSVGSHGQQRVGGVGIVSSGIGGGGGVRDSGGAASNALLAIASASKNERHRRTIIRLFALMGAIDPAQGGFGRNTTSDASSIVVEGIGYDRQRQRGGNGGGTNATAFGGTNVNGLMMTNTNAHANNNNLMGLLDSCANEGDIVPKTSARSRDLILRNVQDLRRETYQFCGEANYPLTVYRMVAKLLGEPEGVSDPALDAALKVAIQLLTDSSNEKILGWDLLEAMMDLVKPTSNVSHQIRLQALNLLPVMIRHRSAVAGQLVREFFSTALSCWDTSCEQTFLPLLTIIEELHIINLKASESFSSCISLSAIGTNETNLPFALGAANEVEELGGRASLYLRLVDVAIADRSPSRGISHKIIAILRLVENQVLIAPVIVNSFVDYLSTNTGLPLDLRVELLRMLLILTYRFSILNCITPIVGLVEQLLEGIESSQNSHFAQQQQQLSQSHHHHHHASGSPLPYQGAQQQLSITTLRDLSASIELILGKRPLTAVNDYAANQDRFATAGSSIHMRAVEVHRQCRRVLQHAAVLYAHANGIPCYDNGLVTVNTGNGQEKVIHVLDYVLTLITTNTNSTNNNATASNNNNINNTSSSAIATTTGGSGVVSPTAGINSALVSKSSPTTAEGNPLDVIVLHINKAYNGMRRGASFEWTQWFTSFQQHVLLHCPNVALRICFDLFNLHEPLRKTLFFPAFHCLLVAVLRSAASNAFTSNGVSGSATTTPTNAHSPSPDFSSDANANAKNNNSSGGPHQRGIAYAIGYPLRRVLTALLRYGDTDSVDMCLGLHDYLEHFRNPNANDTTSQTTVLGALFTAETPQRLEEDEEDGTLRGGCTLPTLQSQRQLSSANIRRTVQAHSLNAASVPSGVIADHSIVVDAAGSVPLLAGTSAGGAGKSLRAANNTVASKASPGQNHSRSATPTPAVDGRRVSPTNRRVGDSNSAASERLPWTLFRAEDLIRAALEHRLHYKAVRYLENDYPKAIKEGSRNPCTAPGRGIGSGPFKSAAAIRGLPNVSNKAAIGRANSLPATSANAVGVVNALALQYSRVALQSSVEGLYNSVHVGVDATGYELLQWWPEANHVYRRRIEQFERDSREWLAIKASSKVGSAGVTTSTNDTAEFFNGARTPLMAPVSSPLNDKELGEVSMPDVTMAEIRGMDASPTSQQRYGSQPRRRLADSGPNSHRESPFLGTLPEPRSMSPFSPLTPTKGDFFPLSVGNNATNANSGQVMSAMYAQHELLSTSNNGGMLAQASAQQNAANQQQHQQSLRPPMTTAPVLRAKDVEGYLRTLCFCGAWDEGLTFAREKFGLLRDAAARSTEAVATPLAAQSRAGGRARPSSATASAAMDETKKAAMSRINVSDSAVMCASLCAVIMNQWEDVKQFSELIIDNTNRLLFTQIYLSRNEIKLFGSSSQHNSPFGSFVGGGGPMLPDLDQVPPSAPAPALLLEIENNLARAIISVDKELKTTMPMGYNHAYETVAKLQHFQEIEEARLYRRKDSSSALQNNIKHMWFQRFQCMRPDALSMLTSIVIYSLAAAPHDIPEAVYHFSKAVRKTHPQLGTWAMSSLQADALQPNTRVHRSDSYGAVQRSSSRPSTPLVNPIALLNPQQRGDVQVDYCEYLWSTGGAAQRQRAIDGLNAFLASPDAIDTTTLSDPSHLVNQTGLQHLGRAHLLLGQWRQEMASDRFWKREHREPILHHLSESIQMVPQEYVTWHSWALMNYRVQQRDVSLKPEERRLYIERSHRGFVAAICRSDRPKVVIQDMMRLLQLWIIYGGVEVLGEAVVDGIHRISASLWATCTPQVVAHLGNEHPPIWAVVRAVLEKTLFSYPQLCIFQLLVPILSDPEGVGSRLRPSRARMLLNIACPETLSLEARAVAEGLVQLAMFPLEYIRDHIGQGLKIIRSVEPPVSPIEIEAIRIPVQQAYVMSQERADALSQVGPVSQVIAELLRLLALGTDKDFLGARGYCERLYNELQDHVKELKSISLQQCTSPRLDLAKLRNLSIWVPGEYTPQRKSAPTIYGFVDRVEVLESKRRPRRMHIVGSDGNINTYCLKGNEDVRVDARAMQLFWLVNSFSATADLQPISRFPVIPLTEDCGLLGWVHESETLYNTIRTFRTRAGIRNDPEMDVMNTEFASPSQINRLAQLTIVQRADLFEHLYKSVESKDMAHVFWYRSVNAELWLKRRTRFTTSLATMSTAGYILGLGDRHPGNLLLQMATGAVVHIDFGDCFDVARYRSSYPETVPFRLTPMLVNAMEVFGVSGAFQATCEASMTSMRNNRDSIVALLSAFVYDPVMDKRITQHHGGNVQGVIDQVRRKLRGMEMPAYYYKQNAHSISWKQPAMSEINGSNRAVATLKAQLTSVSSPNRRYPGPGAHNIFPNDDSANTSHSNMPIVRAGLDNFFPLTSITAAGHTTITSGQQQHFLSSQQHLMQQHTLDADTDEVLHAVLSAAGVDAAATLALDLALNDNENDDNEESTTAPTKREAAVRGEEHVTWALQPRPDLPFVLSQASSERAMKLAGVPRESLTVKDQVRILINEATKCENLSALFAGWTAWW